MSRQNSPQDAEIIIQKIPCDMGIHRNARKGTLNAPEKILEDLDFDRPVMIEEIFPDEFDLEDTHRKIYENTAELQKYSKPVISVGGDHSVSYPVLKALKEANPRMKLVWLDAHLDLKEKVGENISHDVVIRQFIEEGLFKPEEIFFVGITEIDHDEEDFLENNNFNIFRPDEIDQFIEEFEGDAYLSIDIDVLREELAPGTGYPDGTLALEKVLKVIEAVHPVHADIVEVAPTLDNGSTIDSSRHILETLISEV